MLLHEGRQPVRRRARDDEAAAEGRHRARAAVGGLDHGAVAEQPLDDVRAWGDNQPEVTDEPRIEVGRAGGARARLACATKQMGSIAPASVCSIERSRPMNSSSDAVTWGEMETSSCREQRCSGETGTRSHQLVAREAA